MPTDENFASHVEGRLDRVEQHAVGIENRVVNVEKTLAAHGGKLDSIITALTKAEGRPVFNFTESLTVVKDMAILFALVCGGIIWLATIINSAGNAVIANRLDFIEQRLPSSKFSTSIEKVIPQ